MWSRYVKGTNNSESQHSGFKWRFSETLSQTHPVTWLIDMRNDYFKVEEHSKTVMYDYQLIGWQEVSKDIYNKHKDEVG